MTTILEEMSSVLCETKQKLKYILLLIYIYPTLYNNPLYFSTFHCVYPVSFSQAQQKYFLCTRVPLKAQA